MPCLKIARTHYLKEVSEMCKVIEEMRREEREEGFQEGRAVGMREGIKKVIQEGIQEGIQIGVKQKSREIALRMLAAGESDIQKVALYTRLSVDEINALKAGSVQ